MTKRERSSSVSLSLTDVQATSTPADKRFDAALQLANKRAKTKTKTKTTTPSPQKEGKGTKTRWTPQEDEALIRILDEVIKSNLWPAIKASGDAQLIARTSYGCQYHAKMLLKQGKPNN